MIAGVGADECEELADVYVEVNKSFKYIQINLT